MLNLKFSQRWCSRLGVSGIRHCVLSDISKNRPTLMFGVRGQAVRLTLKTMALATQDVDLMDLRFLRISGLRTSNSWFYEAPYVVYKTMGIQLDEQVSWVRNICKFLMNKLTLICHWIWQNKLTSIQIVKCVRNGIELNWIKWLILIIKPKGSTNISNLFLD